MRSPNPPARARVPGPRGLPPFFFVAMTVGAAFLVLFVSQSLRAVRDSDQVRDDGWVAIARDGRWIVGAIRPDGPAGLRQGDQILAIDGDGRAARIGPGWQLADLRLGQPYTITVARDASELTLTLAARARDDPAFRPWVAIYLAVALTCFAVGIMIALARPEDRMVQFVFAGELLTAAFMLWIALRSTSGIRQDGVVLALGLAFPLYYIFAYLFFERFPRQFPATRAWRIVTRAVVAGGVLIWIGRNIVTLLRALPLEPRLDAVDALYPLIRLLQVGGLVPDLIFVVGVLVAMFAVLRRNYLLLPEGSDRRRITVIVWGQLISLVPALISAAAGAVATLAGAGPGVLRAVDVGKLVANGLAIAAPLSLGYAIVKHRVLGFRMAVRVGIQYVLAQNALRTAALLPIAWLIYTAMTHPDRTVGELLFTGAAKFNLAVVVLAAIALQYRTEIASAIDRRFFRAAYDQEAILRRLVESVKQADSAGEMAAMAGREIDAALHVERVLVFFHDSRAGAFSVGYSTQAMPARSPLAEGSRLIQEIGRHAHARHVDDLRASASPRELEWLEELQIALIVPLVGIDGNLVGLLMVGEKRSEEPFTSADRHLLQLVAAQIASVHEVLTLKEKVGRQQEIQDEVLATFDERQINLVKECPACGRCYDRTDERCAADGRELVLSLPVDRTIDGKYRLDRLLGRGGMGAVYEATDQRLRRRVAIKIIKGSSFHSMAARRRFAREAQACARLSHPNIVRVYDYGAPEGQAAYLVMEHVEGRSWTAELEAAGTFSPARTADLLEQVLDGMEAAHAAGVLHRDLKPDNLIISPGPPGTPSRVKILDFGLAKVRESSFADPKSQTMAGLAMGTFGYMSPEQLAAEEVDERTDVYSLGVVALETLTGQLPPFGPNFHPVIEAEVDRRLLRAARTPEQTSVAEAIARALSSNRNRRFASIRQMRDVLIPALRACADLPGVAPLEGGAPGRRVSPAHATTQEGADEHTRAGSVISTTPRIDS